MKKKSILAQQLLAQALHEEGFKLGEKNTGFEQQGTEAELDIQHPAKPTSICAATFIELEAFPVGFTNEGQAKKSPEWFPLHCPPGFRLTSHLNHFANSCSEPDLTCKPSFCLRLCSDMGADMEETEEHEMDAKSTKTKPGTMTELEQSVSDLPMESMDTSVSRDSSEVDDAFIESFQNLHIGTLPKVKVFCVNCFCSCPKEQFETKD
ncbi:hypothetical protein Y1Q_0004688 [Alligator mississippiensis]|uniref:Uncharacterized protein n=1 Tax=Alligator mississippiensis TaxID=8496 RepID=A0A151P6C8_ALLMI|nr:hypothetical protein Y1Q_0004688 [Alligator mississippiensis]